MAYGLETGTTTTTTTTQYLIDLIPVLITPEGPTWNPHSNSYKQNKDFHIDWKGEILDRLYHDKALLNESDDPLNIESVIEMCCDVQMSGPSEFGKMESQLISNIVDESLHYNDQN